MAENGTTGAVQVDYTLSAIQQALLNWPAVLEGESLLLVHLRADMTNAVRRLRPEDRGVVNTVIHMGQAAFRERKVSYQKWGTVTRRLFKILNVEGTY